MMDTNSMGHAEYSEMVAAYVAGGLEGRERAAFEGHVAVCGACAAALEEAIRVDRRLEQLFGESRPAEGLEDRVVRRLREERAGAGRRMMIHPAVWRASGGIAAALVLGAVGYVANTVMEGGRLPWVGRVTAFQSVANQTLRERVGGQGQALRSPATQPTLADRGAGVAINAVSRGGEGATWYDGSTVSYRDNDGDGISDAWLKSDYVSRPDEVARKRIDEVRLRVNEGRSLGREKVGQAEGEQGQGRRFYGRAATNGPKDAPTAAVAAVVETNGQVKELETLAQAGKDVDAYYTLNLNSPQGIQALGEKQIEDTLASGVDAAAAGFGVRADFGEADDKRGGVTPLAAFVVPGGGGVGGGGGAARAPQDAPAVGGVKAGEQGQERPLGIEGVKLADNHFFKPTELADFTSAKGDAERSVEALKRLGSEGKDGKALAGDPASGAKELPALAQNQQGGQAVAQPPAPAQRPAGGGDPAKGTVQNFVQAQTAVQTSGQEQAFAARKIIRNGEMEFEVDGFDSSFVQVTKIVGEEGGFVSSTNSEKLPNGKVRGTVVLRVPPERLDTLVLKLRALGDLKSQKISAQDVTKVYNDLESELKAGRAMEERLLNIIKSGKGEIKDLLEAEKQLGVYRVRIEKLEGEIRYYNNLVSLSTLSITLAERDIRQSGIAAQTEEVNAGIETEDVEKARGEAIKAIEEAKGRIIESNLKKFDAGQLGALVVCDVAPDAAGPLIDRLKQLGRVARLDVERKQTTPTGTAPLPQARVERRETRFTISIYNLANIAPRQTTNMSMAVGNVEETYRSILEAVRGRNGRIVTSSLNRQRPEQTTATVSFEVPAADADATLLEIRREREVVALTVTENPDTNNVTGAKRGFSVQVVSLATVAARETEQQVLATRGNVAETFRVMLEELKKAEARILVSQLNQQDQNNVNGQLDFEVVRAREGELRAALLPMADVISRSVTRSSDVENTVDSKVRVQVRLLSIDQLAPRVTQNLGMAVKDVPTAYREIVATVQEIGGRILTSELNEQDARNVTGTVDFDVLRENVERVEKALGGAGVVYSRAVTRAADTQNTVEMKLRMRVSLRNVEQLPPRETARVMLETADVEKSRGELIAASDAAGGRTIDDTQAIASNGEVSSHLILDVPLGRASEIRQQIKGAGTLRVSDTSRDPQAPDGAVGRARFDVTLTSPGLLVGRDEGLAATIKGALSTSLKGLLWSLNFILIGLLFVGPWVLLLWVAWRVVRRNRVKAVTVPAAA